MTLYARDLDKNPARAEWELRLQLGIVGIKSEFKSGFEKLHSFHILQATVEDVVEFARDSCNNSRLPRSFNTSSQLPKWIIRTLVNWTIKSSKIVRLHFRIYAF